MPRKDSVSISILIAPCPAALLDPCEPTDSSMPLRCHARWLGICNLNSLATKWCVRWHAAADGQRLKHVVHAAAPGWRQLLPLYFELWLAGSLINPSCAFKPPNASIVWELLVSRWRTAISGAAPLPVALWPWCHSSSHSQAAYRRRAWASPRRLPKLPAAASACRRCRRCPPVAHPCLNSVVPPAFTLVPEIPAQPAWPGRAPGRHRTPNPELRRHRRRERWRRRRERCRLGGQGPRFPVTALAAGTAGG